MTSMSEKMNDLILKRVFSKTTIIDLLSGRKNKLFDSAVKKCIPNYESMTIYELLGEIYNYIGKNHRIEYYYKNGLLNQYIKKNHKNNTIFLTELPIADSKADFVAINRKGIVYEIKTELDNLCRLKNQISNYYKAFKLVSILTYEKNVEKIHGVVPDSVGIYVLTNRNSIRMIRGAKEVKEHLDREVIFKMLRKQEFETILKDRGYDLPVDNQFIYYKECFDLIKQIDILSFQEYALQQLKNRVSSENIKKVLEMPYELRLLFYCDHEVYSTCNRYFLNHNYGG